MIIVERELKNEQFIKTPTYGEQCKQKNHMLSHYNEYKHQHDINAVDNYHLNNYNHQLVNPLLPLQIQVQILHHHCFLEHQ